MSFVQLSDSQIMKKPPVLTPEEETTARTAFYNEIVEELVIEGLDTEKHRKIALALATKATVTSLLGGPKVRLNTQNESQMNPQRVARLVVETARMRKFGPDPVAQLTERLVKLGVPEETAASLAKGKVGRHDDGRVWARDAGREIYDGGAPLIRGVSTAEEIAAAHAGSESLTKMTRILLQRYREEQQRQPNDAMVSKVMGEL